MIIMTMTVAMTDDDNDNNNSDHDIDNNVNNYNDKNKTYIVSKPFKKLNWQKRNHLALLKHCQEVERSSNSSLWPTREFEPGETTLKSRELGLISSVT